MKAYHFPAHLSCGECGYLLVMWKPVPPGPQKEIIMHCINGLCREYKMKYFVRATEIELESAS